MVTNEAQGRLRFDGRGKGVRASHGLHGDLERLTRERDEGRINGIEAASNGENLSPLPVSAVNPTTRKIRLETRPTELWDVGNLDYPDALPPRLNVPRLILRQPIRIIISIPTNILLLILVHARIFRIRLERIHPTHNRTRGSMGSVGIQIWVQGLSVPLLADGEDPLLDESLGQIRNVCLNEHAWG